MRAVVVGVCALVLATASCAGGNASGDVDASNGDPADASSGRIDATPLPVADAGPDAGPKAGFGEPCSDKSDCESDICIFVGTGGICTELCVGGSCPGDGEYGCFGVFGVIEPGVVADVCVPLSDQLCTPCSESTECALIGMDLCLEYPDGKSFCSQDCSTVECPGGYTCEVVNIDGTDYDQCIPASTACDCDATTMDDTEACPIMTDFGPCTGTRTCLGDTGWGACEPPSPSDTPDGSFTDDNCDGIDGDLTKAIFVATTTGTDTSTCGLTYTDPCATISQGIIRAITEARGEVYVQAGDYDEVVVMLTGIDVYGGYDDTWQRDDRSVPAHRVTITGGVDSGTGGDSEYLTVRAHNLVVPTTIADVVIVGPNAVGSLGSSARGSYAVHVDNADLVLERVTIQAGDGALGSTGPVGANAPSVNRSSGMNGGSGGNASEFTTACNTTSHGDGGTRGNNTCSGGVNPDGGAGGNGGEMDTCCNLGTCTLCDCSATNGDAGAAAAYSPGLAGNGGSGGSASACGAGGNAFAGQITNGAAGAGAGAGGFLVGSYWYAEFGGNGGVGEHGGGGGGGGGSGGCDSGIDSYGAGGGGGGAGGCRANGGGGGGDGGGGSFGIFAVNATVSATDCSITRGNGGDGGTGGTGGRGQSGGLDGSGGLASGDSKAGGDGGRGGHGGHGGGGGGGAGGISAGVYSYSSSVSHDCTISGGSRGDGGTGGTSAPTAPVAERDGNNGNNGANGSLINTGTCASPGSC